MRRALLPWALPGGGSTVHLLRIRPSSPQDCAEGLPRPSPTRFTVVADERHGGAAVPFDARESIPLHLWAGGLPDGGVPLVLLWRRCVLLRGVRAGGCGGICLRRSGRPPPPPVVRRPTVV